MFLKRFGMYIGIFIAMIILSFWLDDSIKAGVIIISIFMPSYIAISMHRQKKRVNRLEEACDPYDFIKATDEQYAITGKNKRFGTLLKLDRTAGLLCAGQFNEAKLELEALDQSVIRKVKNAQYVYDNNMYVCLKGLGDDEGAKALYENHIATQNPKHQLLQMASLFSKMRYEIDYDNYESCSEMIALLKQRKLSKRLRLQLALFEGELALEIGDGTAAKEHFETVVKEGNKLHLVTIAQAYLSQHCHDF